MAEKEQPNRWRCLITGCNPVLDVLSAPIHKAETGHRVAKWAVRSAEGQKKADKRNRTGYYRKYNVGDKSYSERGPIFDPNYQEQPERENHPIYGYDDGEDDGSWDAHGCFTG